MEKQFEALEIKSRSRQRSAEEIETWVARYRQSGQTQRAFAAAHGIRAGTLARWLYRRGKKSNRVNAAMIPVSVIDSREEQAAVTLRLPTGVEVEFRAPVAVATLQRLIRSGTKRC